MVVAIYCSIVSKSCIAIGIAIRIIIKIIIWKTCGTGIIRTKSTIRCIADYFSYYDKIYMSRWDFWYIKEEISNCFKNLLKQIKVKDNICKEKIILNKNYFCTTYIFHHRHIILLLYYK